MILLAILSSSLLYSQHLIGSHDRWFLDRIYTHLIVFEGDSVGLPLLLLLLNSSVRNNRYEIVPE
jgi:ATPase subunit of ABC transporter with duplicated ATPase domains